jgi:hypothetical protein
VARVQQPTTAATAGVLDPEKRRSEMAEGPAIAGLIRVLDFCLAARPAG